MLPSSWADDYDVLPGVSKSATRPSPSGEMLRRPWPSDGIGSLVAYLSWPHPPDFGPHPPDFGPLPSDLRMQKATGYRGAFGNLDADGTADPVGRPSARGGACATPLGVRRTAVMPPQHQPISPNPGRLAPYLRGGRARAWDVAQSKWVCGASGPCRTGVGPLDAVSDIIPARGSTQQRRPPARASGPGPREAHARSQPN